MPQRGRFRIAVIGTLALGGLGIGVPRLVLAQRVVHSPLARSESALRQGPSRLEPNPALSARHPSDSSLVLWNPSDTPRQTRGSIALRGLLVGAVIGGVVGYYVGRHEEYGGAVGGPIVGAVVGAPIGMLLLLLATPVSHPD